MLILPLVYVLFDPHLVIVLSQDELMDKFQPGNVPHYYITKAFGELAINNRLMSV